MDTYEDQIIGNHDAIIDDLAKKDKRIKELEMAIDQIWSIAMTDDYVYYGDLANIRGICRRALEPVEKVI